MKTYTIICFFLALTMILCPLFAVDKTKDVFSQEFQGETQVIKNESIQSKMTTTVKVMSANSKNITEMYLKDYLIGVVASEINPAYHEEAIKAQIIASHTLLLYLKDHNSGNSDNADITDDSTKHQGFLSKEQQKKKWGDNFNTYYNKIEKCVDEVIDMTMQYDNEYINAVFHAISNGNTERSEDVWGGNYPYLLSVISAGDKLSPAYQSQVTVSEKEFKEILEKENVKFTDEATKWIEKITNTETGMVKNITICGKEFKGTEIRSLFALKSSTFTCEYNDGNFVFTVNGYGHGVGMSQFGADYMARQGFDYKEILKHYYTGVKIV